jgi:hypothetical protein
MSQVMPGAGGAEILTYADRWNAAYGTPGIPLPEDEARRRHEARQRYAAFLGDPERPRVAVDLQLDEDLVQVLFLEDDRRWTMKYVFVVVSRQLWLEQVHLREWLRDGRLRFDSTTFRPDGRVYAERGIDRDPAKEVARGRFDPGSLAFLREPIPAFGDYLSIARAERGAEVAAGRSKSVAASRSS